MRPRSIEADAIASMVARALATFDEEIADPVRQALASARRQGFDCADWDSRLDRIAAARRGLGEETRSAFAEYLSAALGQCVTHVDD